MDAMAVVRSKVRAVPRPDGAALCLLDDTGVVAADALETVKGERYHAVVYSSFDPMSQSGVMAVLCGTLDLSVPGDECETGRIICKAPSLARHSRALRGIADQVGPVRSGPVSYAGGISEVIGHAEH
jgi:hypothetical protein